LNRNFLSISVFASILTSIFISTFALIFLSIASPSFASNPSCASIFSFSEEYVRSRLKIYSRLGKKVRNLFEDVVSEAGWAEVGGRILRDAEGEVVNRTRWVPFAEWWVDRPTYIQGTKRGRKKKGQRKYKHTERQLKAVVEKYRNNLALSSNDKELIVFLLDVVEEKLQWIKGLRDPSFSPFFPADDSATKTIPF
jgi:hypothetical protein